MRASALMLIAAFLMSSAAVPVFAETAQQSETCAISANTCLDRAKILQKRVKKLKAEIKAGKNYNMEEMKVLEQKLQDAMDQLDKIEGK
jgi:anti-sigma28 factor (negative regulator of flagellin synthesis)